jgi:phage-related protein
VNSIYRHDYKRIGLVLVISLALFLITQNLSVVSAQPPDPAELVAWGSERIARDFQHLISIISVIAGWITAIITFIYRNMYIWLDFIITSSWRLNDVLGLIVAVWGVVSAIIGVIMAILSLIAAIFGLIPYIGPIAGVIVALIAIPLAIIVVFWAFVNLFTYILPLYLHALEKMRDWFPPPPEVNEG